MIGLLFNEEHREASLVFLLPMLKTLDYSSIYGTKITAIRACLQ